MDLVRVKRRAEHATRTPCSPRRSSSYLPRRKLVHLSAFHAQRAVAPLCDGVLAIPQLPLHAVVPERERLVTAPVAVQREPCVREVGVELCECGTTESSSAELSGTDGWG